MIVYRDSEDHDNNENDDRSGGGDDGDGGGGGWLVDVYFKIIVIFKSSPCAANCQTLLYIPKISNAWTYAYATWNGKTLVC